MPGSNRGYRPSDVVSLWMLMLHDGARCLEDVRPIRQDKALRKLSGLRRLPRADLLGDWLRRLGKGEVGIKALVAMNRRGAGHPSLSYRPDHVNLPGMVQIQRERAITYPIQG